MSPATKITHDSRSAIRVLVADADADMRSLYRDSLQHAGCDVVDAADGRDALVKALSQRPTLVITDTRLPVFDGYALCAVLRRDSMTRSVPILVVTAEQRRTELDRARDAGADSVLIKPVSPEALVREIQRLLREPERPPEAAPSTASTDQPQPRRTTMARAHARFETDRPPLQPPALVCPLCDRPLEYVSSHIGGINSQHPEQWDAYSCPAEGGTFEYRHRTRTLRRVESTSRTT